MCQFSAAAAIAATASVCQRLFYTIWPRFYQLALKQLTSACSWIFKLSLSWLKLERESHSTTLSGRQIRVCSPLSI